MPGDTGPAFDSFGAWLKYHRVAAQYSQFELARRMGSSHGYIQYLENDPRPPGEKRPLKASMVKSVAEITGADLAQGRVLAGLPATAGPETEQPFFCPKTIQIAQAYESAPIYVRRAVEVMLLKNKPAKPDAEES